MSQIFLILQKRNYTNAVFLLYIFDCFDNRTRMSKSLIELLIYHLGQTSSNLAKKYIILS